MSEKHYLHIASCHYLYYNVFLPLESADENDVNEALGDFIVDQRWDGDYYARPQVFPKVSILTVSDEKKIDSEPIFLRAIERVNKLKKEKQNQLEEMQFEHLKKKLGK